MEENKRRKIDDDGSDSDEEEVKHPLEDSFISMFPFTSRTYIRNRLANLPNNPEAVARLTEELLKNPTPVGNDIDQDDDDLTEDINQWKDAKLSEMRGIFSDLCPDFLMETLNGTGLEYDIWPPSQNGTTKNCTVIGQFIGGAVLRSASSPVSGSYSQN